MPESEVRARIRQVLEDLVGDDPRTLELALDRIMDVVEPFQQAAREELEAMRAAARELNKMIASWGRTEDQLMAEYKEIRRPAREARRNAR